SWRYPLAVGPGPVRPDCAAGPGPHSPITTGPARTERRGSPQAHTPWGRGGWGAAGGHRGPGSAPGGHGRRRGHPDRVRRLPALSGPLASRPDRAGVAPGARAAGPALRRSATAPGPDEIDSGPAAPGRAVASPPPVGSAPRPA